MNLQEKLKRGLHEANIKTDIHSSNYRDSFFTDSTRAKLLGTVGQYKFYSDETNEHVKVKKLPTPKELAFVANFIMKYMPQQGKNIVVLDYGYESLAYSLQIIHVAVNSWQLGRFINVKDAHIVLSTFEKYDITTFKESDAEISTESRSLTARELSKIAESFK
jgi:hypothetical protein